jgi:hypothetical protein
MSAKSEIWTLMLAALAAGLILKFGFGGTRDFENAALGTLTVHYNAKSEDGLLIHTIKQAELDVMSMLGHAQGQQEVTLILGNSQTHSINQKKPGEVNYPELLQKSFPEQVFLTNSLPNANLQEFAVASEWWAEQVSFQTLILPVFMDDLREGGLRKDFLSGLVRDEFKMPSAGSALVTEWNETLASFQESQSEGTVSTEGIETPQEITEREINAWLADRSEIWRNRPNARGDLFMKLYQWRNTLFGINASTKRKMIPSRYERNFEALDLILENCQNRGVQVILYIPPIRTDVEVPYDLGEYTTFKLAVEEKAKDYQNVSFNDFDSIVPGEYWGLKASTTNDAEPELDFMHFQFKGHEILADSLAMALNRIAALP